MTRLLRCSVDTSEISCDHLKSHRNINWCLPGFGASLVGGFSPTHQVQKYESMFYHLPKFWVQKSRKKTETTT